MPTHPPRLPVGLFDRYLAGACTPDEVAQVRAALTENPELRAVADRVRAPAAYSADAMWTRHQARTQSAAATQLPRAARSRRGWRVPAMTAAAAAIAVIAVLAGRSVTRAPATASISDYQTPVAQQMTVTFPDGSRAVLAPETRVRFTRDANGARTISLSGQAFFTVTHDPAHAFVVRTGAVDTRVLGTAFDVRAYPSDRDVRVAVTEGRVASGGRDTAIVLTAGAVARVTDSTVTLLPSADARAETAWVDGKITFKNANVPEVLEAVERWSGYRFRIADSSISAQRVTTVLRVRDSERTLQMLKELLDVTMRFDGTTVTLVPRRHSAVTPAIRRSPAIPSTVEMGK